MTAPETLKSPKFTPIFHVLNIVCLAIFVYSLTHFIMSSDNTLEEHGLWDSEKMHLDIPIPGAESFYRGREALKGSELRLGEWGGFNQLTFRSGDLHNPLAFNLTLLPWGDFSLFLSATPNGFQGVRISRHPAIPSGFFEVDRRGRFLFFDQIKTKFEFKNNQTQLYYEKDHIVLGKSIVSLPEVLKLNGFNFLGFRSGAKQTILSDVSMGIESHVKIRFDFLEDFYLYFIPITLFLIGLYYAIHINFRVRPLNIFFIVLALAAMSFTLDIYDSKTQVTPFPHMKKMVKFSSTKVEGENILELVGQTMIFGEGAHHSKDSFLNQLKKNPRLKSHSFRLVHRDDFELNQNRKAFFIYPQDTKDDLQKLMESSDANSLFVLIPHPYHWDTEKMTEFTKQIGENGFQLINAHQYLWQRKATGFLFWSEGALTSWGQELLAEAVEEGLNLIHE